MTPKEMALKASPSPPATPPATGRRSQGRKIKRRRVPSHKRDKIWWDPRSPQARANHMRKRGSGQGEKENERDRHLQKESTGSAPNWIQAQAREALVISHA